MKSTKKRKYNLYRWINKNRKVIISSISILIVVALLFGIFSQLIYVINAS